MAHLNQVDPCGGADGSDQGIELGWIEEQFGHGSGEIPGYVTV